MLSHALISPLLHRKAPLKSFERQSTRFVSRPEPAKRLQRREIFSVVKAALKRWGPWKRPKSPFNPSNREVRYTKHNVWARAGPVEGTLLMGITEQAKDLLRPIVGVEVQDRLGSYLLKNDRFAFIMFYHPQDVEENREEKEILEWPIQMPSYGVLESINPSASPSSISSPDLLHRNWIFSITEVHQWDWDSLLTEEEYLNHVMRTGNLLEMKWQKSSKIPNIFAVSRTTPPPIDYDKALYETIQRQKEIEGGHSQNTPKL